MILIIYAIYSLNCLYLFKLEDFKNILFYFCNIKIEKFAIINEYKGFFINLQIFYNEKFWLSKILHVKM